MNWRCMFGHYYTTAGLPRLGEDLYGLGVYRIDQKIQCRRCRKIDWRQAGWVGDQFIEQYRNEGRII